MSQTQRLRQIRKRRNRRKQRKRQRVERNKIRPKKKEFDYVEVEEG